MHRKMVKMLQAQDAGDYTEVFLSLASPRRIALNLQYKELHCIPNINKCAHSADSMYIPHNFNAVYHKINIHGNIRGKSVPVHKRQEKEE